MGIDSGFISPIGSVGAGGWAGRSEGGSANGQSLTPCDLFAPHSESGEGEAGMMFPQVRGAPTLSEHASPPPGRF